MANNSPRRKFKAVQWLVTYITGSMGGIWGAIVGYVLSYFVNELARRSIYFIDVSSSIVRTNMDEATWQDTVADSFERVDQGNLTDVEGKAIDNAFKSAFNNFAVFKRIKRSR